MGKKKADLGLLAGLGKRIVDTVRVTGEAVVGKPKEQLGNTTITPSFTGDRAFVYGVGAIVFVGGGWLMYELIKRGLATINPTPNQPNNSLKLIASGQALPPVPNDILVVDGGTQPNTRGEYVIKVKKGLKALELYNGAKDGKEDATWVVNSDIDNALRRYADQNGLADKTSTATRLGTYSIVDWYKAIQKTLKDRGVTFAGLSGGFALLSGINGLGCGCMHA